MINILPFPYEAKPETTVKGKYLYAIGGYYDPDIGCPAWGTSDPADIRFLGDCMGEIVIRYTDGREDRFPLVLGYTLWLHSIWNESPAPFYGKAKDDRLTELLTDSLCLYGAWERKENYILRIALPDRPILSITAETSPVKNGHPVFTGLYVTDAEEIPETAEDAAAAAFFTAHTVSLEGKVPTKVTEALESICYALHTFEADFADAPAFLYPAVPEYGKIRFFGSPIAEIASGVVYFNMENLKERTDSDGFIHTSYRNAPSWRYDGFGPYVCAANSYWDSFYSRDGARAIMTLNSYGYTEKAEAACEFGNRWMMTYPEEGLTIGGKPIPGHFSVIPNKPFIYSKVLTKIGAVPALCDDPDADAVEDPDEPTCFGWPTRYTRRKFGDEHENLGNQETDGHGLMMLGVYNVWHNLGCTREYVEKNWNYIQEAARWIVWCFDNPDVSFVKDDLLYGETEAAMNDYTLYANVPCYLGIMGYAEMAEAVGKTEEAALWRKYGARLRAGIDAGLARDGRWNEEKFGFIHDPVVTMLSDYCGYDTADMPVDWLERSRAVYRQDLEKTVAHGWYGASGIGYNHSMMTQNALLLDQMADAGRLVESLTKLSYSPRLPEPYMVPEGLAVDAEKGILRRQGDLGNLVQLAEAMKSYLLVSGISPVWQNTLKVMPRLPEGWSVSLEGFPVQNSTAQIAMHTSYPIGNCQEMELQVDGGIAETALWIRFGPFPTAETEANITLNGKTYILPLAESGDSKWAWLKQDCNAL